MTGYSPKYLTLALLAGFSGVSAQAAQVPTVLPPVSVTATRLSKEADLVAPNVVVKTAQGEDAAAVRDLHSLLEDEPGVSVPRDLTRRGSAGVAIRGIEGNRILMMVDGVSLPSLYMGGGAPISGRDVVELDHLSAVEVIKGAYSSLYGADAMGGVVAFRTLEVADLLKQGQASGGRLRAGAYGEDGSYQLGLGAAFKGDKLSGLVNYVSRKGHEQDNKGERSSLNSSRTTPNPLDWNSQALLLKLKAQLHPGAGLELTYEQFKRQQDGDIISARSSSPVPGGPGAPAMTATVLSQLANDETERKRVKLAYEYGRKGDGLVAAKFSIYGQDADSHEFVGEIRQTTMAGQALPPVRRTTDSGFTQKLKGVDGQLSYFAELGESLHTVVVGAEYSKTETSRPRMRQEFKANGTVSNVVAGEVFPHKTFPDNDSERVGLYVQDEMVFASNLSLTPALRYDHYRLTPKPDALYAVVNPGKYQIAKYSAGQFSPRLALNLPLGQAWTLYGQLGSGFRAPNFDDAMLSFTNAAHGYEIKPNADLKAEKSVNFETGLRFKSEPFTLGVTAFYSRYRDFIERVLTSSTDANQNGVALEYQAQNLSGVRIAGLELKSQLKFSPAWQLAASLAYAKGDERTTGKPLDSIEPLNGKLALIWAQGSWQSQLGLRMVGAKTRLSDDKLFKAPGYGVLDASARYRFGNSAELNVGVYNLADRKYWQWSDVRGLTASSTVLDRYSSSGRKFGANFDYRF